MVASSWRWRWSASSTGWGMSAAPALLKCSTVMQPGVSRRARSRSSVTASGAPQGLAHRGEALERAQHLPLIVGEVPDDDVGIAHGGQRAELLRHLLHRAPDERGGVEAAIAPCDDGAGHRLRRGG